MLTYNPYELIYMSRMEDTTSMSVLFDEYTPYLIHLKDSIIGRHSVYDGYNDDFLLEMRIAMMDAVMRYRDDQDASWRTFLTLLVKRKVVNQLRKTEVKNWIENTISFEGILKEEGNIYEHFAQDDFFGEPEKYLAYQEGLDKINQVVRMMNPNEKRYVYLWLNQVRCKEGSATMNIPQKRWYKQMSKVQQKVRDTLKS